MDPFIGEIRLVGFNFAPKGWAICNGQLLPIAQYQALFSLLGTTYGGDGRTTFGLPDFRARAAIGIGPSGALAGYDMGETVGLADGSGNQAGLLSANYIIALQGIYPSRQ